MYPHLFSYHRAGSLTEATSLLQKLGEEAKFIAGEQSLIPLMKMRLARPAALIDINHIMALRGSERHDGAIRMGALARHVGIAASSVAAVIPIVHDCAAGIADIQVRNMGTQGAGAFLDGPGLIGFMCSAGSLPASFGFLLSEREGK